MRSRIRAAIAALALGATGHAAPQVDEAATIVADLGRQVDAIFALDEETRALLDAPLLAAVEDLRQSHLTRAKVALKTWTEEALAQTEPDSAPAVHRVFHRLINETVIWRTQTAGPAHEAALAATWASALPCRDAFDGKSDFANAVRQLRHAPPAHRTAALDGERRLLGRWGQAHEALVPPPLPRFHAALRERIALFRAGGAVPQPPMPPAVASVVVDDGEQPSQWTRCAMMQWWLQVQGASGDGVARSRALSALRYANAPLPREWLSQDQLQRVARADDESGYPGIARRFGVEGTTRVRVELDGQSRLRRAELIERIGITVPGVPSGEAVAFADLLDDAATAKLAGVKFGNVPPDELKDGVAVRTVNLNWNLK